MSRTIIKGTIKYIYDTRSWKSGFRKREFIVTTDEQYPQDLKIEMLKEDCDLLNDYREGELVECDADIRGNEYQEKFYVNIVCCKIARQDIIREEPPVVPSEPPVSNDEVQAAQEAVANIPEVDDDPLPF